MRARLPSAILLMLSAVAVAAPQGVKLGKGPQAGPQVELPPLLKRALEASRTARFSGERSVEFRTRGERKVLREFLLKDGPRIRIEFPDDSEYRGQVIVENGKERRHYFPDKNEIWVLPPRGDEPLRRLWFHLSKGRHRGGIAVQVLPGSAVAGLETSVAVIADRSGNPMQKLWIHPKSGIVLRKESFDRTGSLVAGFQFTRINLEPRIAQGDFAIVRRGAVVVTPTDMVKRHAAELGLTTTLVPPSLGYKLLGVRIMRRGDHAVLAQTYAGPSGRFTLFQVKAPVNEQRLNRFGRGELATHSWVRGDESFALVGDLPATELQSIARQIGGS